MVLAEAIYYVHHKALNVLGNYCVREILVDSRGHAQGSNSENLLAKSSILQDNLVSG